MPIHSRLLALAFIVAGNCTVIAAWAQSDTTLAKATETSTTPTSVSTPANHESIGNGFPFNAQNVPSAKAETAANPAPANKTTTVESTVPVVDSPKVVSNQCAKPAENQLHKSLLVMAFPRMVATTSTAGELYLAEQQVPQLLSQQLVNGRSSITPVQLLEGLLMPDVSNDTALSMQVQRLARNHRTQMVVSGEILDMSMAHPEATYNPGLFTRAVNGSFDFISVRNPFDKRDRIFSFQLHLRDGFTGQLLFTKRYNTFGIWGEDRPVGFGTAAFWKTDYGQQVKGLIRKASIDVGEVIQCQPFIAQIESRPGQTQVALQGGANNGLHAGDMLTLYQLVVEGSESQYQQHDVRLVNRNTAIELREVYPSHSVGVINTTSYLNGQFLAVAP